MPSKKDKKIRLTPTQKLKEEIKILKNEIDLSKEKNLRIKAEFENYKKLRNCSDKDGLPNKAKARLIDYAFAKH